MSAPSSARPLEAVIFDWGGTLTPWHAIDLREQWQVYARQIHDDRERAEALGDAILAAEHDSWQHVRKAQTSARMEEILAEAGADLGHTQHEAGVAAYRSFWHEHTITDPQVGPLWEGLRAKGIRVGVLSNTIWSGDYHRGIFERDGVAHLIDGQIYSSEIPWTKPHVEAYRAAADAVGVDPRACAYVGDRLFEDVYGSQQAGMRAILIPHSDIPVNQRVEGVEATPDAQAHELLDVLTIVDSWT
ncbi:HAD family hydrolase [Luteipulveratus mongoliensis]|uniref:Haloacid dehalogenase n=1 Tax=Luteipulveratus mongoliensis TaxID=571913 RepID=A0A0K1JIP9_9MICO|nr:HAD family hydrolase [Luteipulveratus mongoliensis]AKU16455.1 haloacid dehalogenase [Luteipulveratus mongoliensis]